MILNILNQPCKTLFKNHIITFKNKFFELFDKKKILILNEDCDMNEYFKCYYRYLCRLIGISDIHIIIDGNTKEIILVFNRKNIESSYNVAFHGEEIGAIKNDFDVYDRVIDDFDLNSISSHFIVVQKFTYENKYLEFDIDTKHIFDYLRIFKSDYEIMCTMRSTQKALKGHINVENLYLKSEDNIISESSIYSTYISSLELNVDRYPYNPITAIGSNCAILHYKFPSPSKVYADSILVDAGATFNGYCSDITKTYSKDSYWNNIIRDLKILQKLIIDNIKIGHNFYDLFIYSQRLMVEFLIKHKYIINIDNCSNFDCIAFELQLDRLFYMHGLGHLLGLYVHDVGSNLEVVNNKVVIVNVSRNKPRNFILENRVLFTIEPGFYINCEFINKFCRPEQRKYINFNLVKDKQHYGGVRIETNILIYNDKVYDITTILEKETYNKHEDL